jgi:hypothetical protein
MSAGRLTDKTGGIGQAIDTHREKINLLRNFSPCVPARFEEALRRVVIAFQNMIYYPVGTGMKKKHVC